MRGKIRIFKVSPAGAETTIEIFSVGSVMGEFAVVDSEPRSATAKAIEAADVLVMSHDRFLRHMRQMPDLALGMTKLLASRVRWTASFAETIAQYDAAGRLLHMLLLYNEQFGQSVPTLSSQALAGGAQSGGSSLFTNTISNVQTGVSLNILARVNASGIITMQIEQEVSSPVPPAAGGIQSPTIDRRSVSTQVTVNDGDPIAIAGIIQETDIYGASRVPILGRIPVLGALFGSTSLSHAKSELVIIMRPRVIYDENEIVTASEELTDRLRMVRRLMRE
jgi:CRP-like cAMP-binding protein